MDRVADLDPRAGNPPRVEACPVCHGGRWARVFPSQQLSLESCANCGLVIQNPQPADATLQTIYGNDYFIGSDDEPDVSQQFELVKRQTARLQLDRIGTYLKSAGSDRPGRRLIEIGCGHGNLLLEARARQFDVYGLELSAAAAKVANASLGGCVQVGTVESVSLPSNHFDVCVMADVIEHTRAPDRLLAHVFRLLKPGGVVFLATPSLDSWSARVLGSQWMEFKLEHLYYFNRSTISHLLVNSGFSLVDVHAGRKVLTPGYIIGHFKKFPVPFISASLAGLASILPSSFTRSRWTLIASGIDVLATKGTG